MEPFFIGDGKFIFRGRIACNRHSGAYPVCAVPAVGACWAWIAFWTLYAGLSLGACFPLVAARNGKVQHRGGGCAGIGDGGV